MELSELRDATLALHRIVALGSLVAFSGLLRVIAAIFATGMNG